MKMIFAIVISACLGGAAAFEVCARQMEKGYQQQMEYNRASIAREDACRVDLATSQADLAQYKRFYEQVRAAQANPAQYGVTGKDVAAAILKAVIR